MPLTLAIEISNPSSGPRGPVRGVETGPGVALGGESGEHLGTELLRDGSNHDDDLMPAIDRLFARYGAAPADLGLIAVSAGPGGFTALRIAIATAKMLAEATGARVVSIPSASVAAWTHEEAPRPLLVCLASKGDTAFATMFRPDGTSQVAGLIRACDLHGLAPAALVADRFLPEPIRAAAAISAIPVLEPVFSARAVLELTRTATPVSADALTPIYPRPPEAVTLWAKRKL